MVLSNSSECWPPSREQSAKPGEIPPEGSCYFGPASIKAQAQINWEDAKAREKFLTSIVAYADRLLEMARQTLTAYAPESDEHKKLTEAAELLAQLLLQDVGHLLSGALHTRSGSRLRMIHLAIAEIGASRKGPAPKHRHH